MSSLFLSVKNKLFFLLLRMAAVTLCRRSLAFFGRILMTSFTVEVGNALEGSQLRLGIVGCHIGVMTGGAFLYYSAFSQGGLFAVRTFSVMTVSAWINILMCLMSKLDGFVSFFRFQDQFGRTGVRGETGSSTNGHAEYKGKSCGAE
jgi:hypothetical protein